MVMWYIPKVGTNGGQCIVSSCRCIDGHCWGGGWGGCVCVCVCVCGGISLLANIDVVAFHDGKNERHKSFRFIESLTVDIYGNRYDLQTYEEEKICHVLYFLFILTLSHFPLSYIICWQERISFVNTLTRHRKLEHMFLGPKIYGSSLNGHFLLQLLKARLKIA